MHLDDSITRLVQEIEDLCKGNDNVPRQLLYKSISAVRIGYMNRRDIYDTLGGPILVILYCISATPKATIYRKSAGMARTDNICCTKTPTSLIMAAIEGIKSQLCHIVVILCYNSIHIAFDNHFLLLWYRGLQQVSNV